MDQTTHKLQTLPIKRLKIEEPECKPFVTQMLPNELWLEIFSHLSAQDVITNVNKVCTHFHSLTQDSKLIKKLLSKGCLISRLLTFLNLPLDDGGLKEMEGVTLINIGRNKDCISIVKTALQFCSNLISIKINWSPARCPSEFLDEDMKHMISFGQNLKYLELEYIDIASDWGLEQLTKLNSLEVLKMKLFRTFTVDNLIPFGNCKNLRILNVEINYTSFSSHRFSKFLKNNKRPLKKLDFKKPELIFNGPKSYFQFTAEWSESSIDWKNEFQPIKEVTSDLRTIFPILPPYSQQIKILRIQSDYIFADSDLMFANQNFGKLKELFITASISKTILRDISRNCPLLQVLQLNGSENPHPEDDDLIALFSHCNQLEKLSLRNIGGGSWGRPGGLTANFLNNINDYLPNLKYLNLEGIQHKKVEIQKPEPYGPKEVYEVIFGTDHVIKQEDSHQRARDFIENHVSGYDQHLNIRTKHIPGGIHMRKKLVDTDEPKITNKLLRDIAMKYENDIVIINPKGTTIKKSLLDKDLEELEKIEEESTDSESNDNDSESNDTDSDSEVLNAHIHFDMPSNVNFQGGN